MKVVLNLDEVLLIRGILRHGFVRDLHPNYRASASTATIDFYDQQRGAADTLLARLDTHVTKATGS